MPSFYPGDTIKIVLPLRLPSLLKIILTGQKATCSGEIIALNCTDIVTFHRDLNGSEYLNYTYLTPGSHVTVPPQDVPHSIKAAHDTSYYVGLFASIRSAIVCERYKENDYRSFSECCLETNQKTMCRSIRHSDTNSMVLTIDQPSYYFLRCDDEGFNCSELSHYYFNQTGYDFSRSNQSVESHKYTVLKAQAEEPVPLHIHAEYFPVHDVHNMCVLATLEGNCGNHNDKYFLNIHYFTHYHEYIVYISIGIGFYCIFCVIVTMLLFRKLCTQKLCNRPRAHS